MFPAIREAFREWRGESKIQELGLKESVSFNTVNVDWYARNGYPKLYSLLGGAGPSWSGESVSIDSALNHSVVWACNRIIAETAASLPCSLLRRMGETRSTASDLPAHRLLHDEPNEKMSDMDWREAATSQAVLRGNAYARIIRRPVTGEAIAIYPAAPGEIRADSDTSNRLVYIDKEGNSAEKTYVVERNKPHDVFHLRGLGFTGLEGVSVVGAARQSIGNALAAERFVGKFYGNGGRLPYVLNLEKNFRSDQEFEKFRSDWESTYREPHRAPMLLPGIEYKQVGLNAADSQFLESRQFSVSEICRWFRISPHLVGDLSKASYNSIEQLALEFVTMTLMSWLVRWEKAINRCVLSPAEKASGVYAKHNVSALLRGDFQSRMKGYSIALQNGLSNIDECRELEDWNPLASGAGKAHHIQLNMQTIPGTGEPTSAELSAAARGTAKGRNSVNKISETAA
jgi:HK97 family phage portal protein